MGLLFSAQLDPSSYWPGLARCHSWKLSRPSPHLVGPSPARQTKDGPGPSSAYFKYYFTSEWFWKKVGECLKLKHIRRIQTIYTHANCKIRAVSKKLPLSVVLSKQLLEDARCTMHHFPGKMDDTIPLPLHASTSHYYTSVSIWPFNFNFNSTFPAQ